MNNILKFDDFLLTEMKRNYKVRDFKRDCKKLGFEIENTTDGFMITKEVIDKEGNMQTINVACHNQHKNGGENDIIDPAAINMVKFALIKEYQYTGSMQNINNAPWSNWGSKIPEQEELDNPLHYKDTAKEEAERIEKERMELEVTWLNNRWNNVKPEYMLNQYNYDALKDAFIGSKEERGVIRHTVFKSIDDRRPLCGWYDEVIVDGDDTRLETRFAFANTSKTKTKGLWKKQTITIFPIKKDGTISNDTFEI